MNRNQKNNTLSFPNTQSPKVGTPQDNPVGANRKKENSLLDNRQKANDDLVMRNNKTVKLQNSFHKRFVQSSYICSVKMK